MGEGATLPPGPGKGSLTIEETTTLWRAFQDGGAAACPRDGRPLALSVDGGGGYRFVCTCCGVASIWFEATTTGIQSRTVPPPPMGKAPDDDD
jgi:hypothetical protein